jgi:hypothetical protein
MFSAQEENASKAITTSTPSESSSTMPAPQSEPRPIYRTRRVKVQMDSSEEKLEASNEASETERMPAISDGEVT